MWLPCCLQVDLLSSLQFLSTSAGIPAWPSPPLRQAVDVRHKEIRNGLFLFVENAEAYHVVPYVLRHVFRECLVVCSEF